MTSVPCGENTIDWRKRKKIRTLGEKETDKYLSIMEVDTINQVKIKEKKLESVSQENEKTIRNQTM